MSATVRNRISPAPNVAAAIGIIFESPRTLLRAASDKADTSAPTPVAPIRKPNVCGPPCNTFEANTGISTVYGMPIRLTSANSSRIVRRGADFETYAQPSLSCSSMEVPVRFARSHMHPHHQQEAITAR